MKSAWRSISSFYVLNSVFAPMRNSFIYIILILECVRLKQAWSFSAHLPNPLWSISKYLLEWLPAFSGLALQVALVVGLMMGLAKLSRSRELDAMHALGQSMNQLLSPVFILTAVVICCHLVILGWLQPLMIYYTNSFIHEVEQSSVLISEGSEMFRIKDNKTILIDGISRDGKKFDRVFIYETFRDQKTTTTAGTQGKLTGDGNLSNQHYFVDNLDVLEVKNTPTTQYSKAFSLTHSANVQGPLNIVGDLDFRKRGIDEFEWTFDELLTGGPALPYKLYPASINAELNYRFVELLFIVLFPFIAVITVIEPRRNPGPMRFFAGILFVLAFIQYLGMGTNLSRGSVLPPIVTLWLPLGLVMLCVAFFYWKIAYRQAFKTAR